MEKVFHRIYWYNLYLAIWIFVVFIPMPFQLMMGLKIPSFFFRGLELLIFIYAILLHIQNRKAKLSSLVSYIIYAAQVVSIVQAVSLVVASSNGNEIAFVLFVISEGTGIILQIVAAIFAILAAKKLKREYPEFVRGAQKSGEKS